MSSESPYFDLESWKKAAKLTIRVLGYMAAFFVVLTLITIIPAYFIFGVGEVYNNVASFTYLLTLIFLLIAIMKVIDEEQKKPVVSLSQESIKLK